MDLEINGTSYAIIKLVGEEKLNMPSKFMVTVLLPQGGGIEKLLLSSAVVKFDGRDAGGVVTSVIQNRLELIDQKQAELTIESRLALAKNQVNMRIFQRQTLEEIITDCLLEIGYSKSAIKFSFHKENPFAKRRHEYLMQSAESDLDFVNRLAARSGLWYWFSFDGLSEAINFADDISCFPERGAIYYNPKINFAEAAVLFLEPRYSLVSPKLAVAGKSNIASLQTGTLVKLKVDDLRFDIDGLYLVSELSHQLTYYQILQLENTPENISYHNSFQLYPINEPCRAPITSPNYLPSMFQAVIAGDGSQPKLDQEGRYFFQPKFELEAQTIDKATPRLTLFAGVGSETASAAGWHTPLIDGAEVLVSCLSGDPDQPIILGALYHQENISPVLLENNQQHILRSPGGNQLLMDDKCGAERVELSTCGQDNIFFADAFGASLASKKGEVKIQAQQDIEATSANDFKETAAGSRNQLVAGDYVVKAQNLDYEAKGNYQLLASNNVVVEVAQEIINKSGKDINLTAPRIDIFSRQNNLTFAAKGNIAVEAAKVTISSSPDDGMIEIGQSNAGLRLTSAGEIIISAKQLRIKADELSYIGDTNLMASQRDFKLTEIAQNYLRVAADDKDGAG